MPLGEHLRELRNRLMKAVLAILVVTIVAMIYYKPIAEFLMHPVRNAVGCTKGFGEAAAGGETCAEITINGMIEPFTIMLKVSLTAGVVAASPIWLHQLWAFLAPGLHRHEKKYARSFVAAGFPLFLGGAFLAYITLPTAAETMLSFTPDGTGNLIPLDKFFDIITRMVIAFGIAFELPLLLVMLNLGGVLSARRMLGWWRAMVLCITLFAAIATPGGDPLTMCVLAAPMVALFFSAVGIAFFNDRRRKRNDPHSELNDDEAAPLDLAPEAIEGTESVPAPRALPDGEQAPRNGDGRTGTDGYDDAT